MATDQSYRAVWVPFDAVKAGDFKANENLPAESERNDEGGLRVTGTDDLRLLWYADVTVYVEKPGNSEDTSSSSDSNFTLTDSERYPLRIEAVDGEYFKVWARVEPTSDKPEVEWKPGYVKIEDLHLPEALLTRDENDNVTGIVSLTKLRTDDIPDPTEDE